MEIISHRAKSKALFRENTAHALLAAILRGAFTGVHLDIHMDSEGTFWVNDESVLRDGTVIELSTSKQLHNKIDPLAACLEVWKKYCTISLTLYLNIKTWHTTDSVQVADCLVATTFGYQSIRIHSTDRTLVSRLHNWGVDAGFLGIGTVPREIVCSYALLDVQCVSQEILEELKQRRMTVLLYTVSHKRDLQHLPMNLVDGILTDAERT